MQVIYYKNLKKEIITKIYYILIVFSINIILISYFFNNYIYLLLEPLEKNNLEIYLTVNQLFNNIYIEQEQIQTYQFIEIIKKKIISLSNTKMPSNTTKQYFKNFEYLPN